MPETRSLLWIYVGALALFVVTALALDAFRSRKRERNLVQGQATAGRAGRQIATGNTEWSAGDLALGASGKVDARCERADEGPPQAAPATVQQPATRRTDASRQRGIRIAEDVEFLPAALEILETPPSPTATALMLGICLVFATALLWATIGKLDIHAVAMGKIQPSGRTKTVQPLEPGRIAAIRVESGQTVEEGEVLVELDPTESAADLKALERELESTTAEALRRNAAVDAARSLAAGLPTVIFPKGIGDHVRRREVELLAADLAQFRTILDAIRAQIAEKQATKQRLTLSIEARKKLLGLSKERVGMREEIKTRGAGSRALIIEAELQYENFRTTDASERGQLIEADASIISLEKRLRQVQGQFVAEQAEKAADADRKRDRLEQEIVKARSKRDRTQLRAPTAGIVQQVEVTTLGQVVTSGQSLMTVVPVDAPLEVEAMVANKDIGFVTPGQRAVVKVEAFPFTRYGSIEAEVVRVSRDAVEDRNVTSMMDAASAARPQGGGSSNGPPGQNLVFPAVVKLSRRTINVDGKDVSLSPGMAVTVEIKTGERRAISYVLSPLKELFSQSARER
ncbi:MAG: HlyD family type I secretion periplasmic adaptor subunit [Hyphomicrobiaceae bacterium]